MERIVSGIGGLFSSVSHLIFNSLLFAIITGLLLGFVCSSGIVKINCNGEKANALFKNGVEKLQKTEINGVNNMNYLTPVPVSANQIPINRSNKNSKQVQFIQTYTAKKGEDLISIAQHFQVKWRKIAELNCIKNPYSIMENDFLLIPQN